MERRIGSVLILIHSKECIHQLNTVLSRHADIIIGRQGLSLKEKHLNIISLVLEGTTDEIGSLTGQIGRLEGINVKSVLAKQGND